MQKTFKGEIDTTDETREFYSHDASLFEVKPQVVAFPSDSSDIKAAVVFVAANKAAHPESSITPRSRGTDMSGAAVGESIVLDVSKHLTELYEVSEASARFQPGILYKDFEVETLKYGSIFA